MLCVDVYLQNQATTDVFDAVMVVWSMIKDDGSASVHRLVATH